jgi:HD-GYP domain-containing protein (c-di-GMP phosphodiesterase class II)
VSTTPSPSNPRSSAAAAEIIYNLGVCLRLAAVYDLANASLRAPIEALVASVNDASRDGGTLAVQAVQEKFYLNKRFVRLDAEAFEAAVPLLQVFGRLRINEVAFSAVQLEERHVREFLASFKRHYAGNEPWALARETFEAVAVRTIDGTEADAFDAETSPQQAVVRQYSLLVVYLRRIVEALHKGTPTRLAGLRRMLQALADASEGHEPLLIALTAFEQFQRQPQAHQARCAAFALLIGRRLGLPRATLIDLALAALFHDVAREDGPDASGAAPAAGSGRPIAEEVRRIALGTMLRMCHSGVGLDSHLRLAVARDVWQPLQPAPGPSVPARLLAVACAFDLLTRPAPPRRGLTPDHALRILVAHAGTRYDLRAVRALASAIGIYPPGTVVDLTDGSVAAVKGISPELRPTLQRVRGPQAGAPPVPAGTRPPFRGCVDWRERGVNVIHAFLK